MLVSCQCMHARLFSCLYVSWIHYPCLFDLSYPSPSFCSPNLCTPAFPPLHNIVIIVLTIIVTIIFKKFRNISKEKSTKCRDGCMDIWRHWLTKYTNKKSTFHNIATFHTAIPTQVAVDIDIVPWPPIICYSCRDGCVKCSNVVENALLVCILCQPVHTPPSIHPSLHLVLRHFFLK